jgi:polyether ionophore transport system permease protein
VTTGPSAPTGRRPVPLWVATGRRAFLDARTRTIVFAYVFAVYAWVQAAGYRGTYPTLADRMDFARAFAGNDAIRIFYGFPYDVVSVGGYCAWRVGGTLALAAAAYGVLAAVRALRTEEDEGRAELVLAGALGRSTYFASCLGAMALGTVVLFVLEFVGFVAARLPVAGSAFLALSTALVVPFFVGLGALASQVASTRRGALALATGALGLFWLVRMIADTWPAAAGLRWATPLGWAEASRPFAGSSWWPLVLLGAAAVPLLALAARLDRRRDVGVGIVPAREGGRPRLAMLSSTTAQAMRTARGTLLTWTLGFAVFAVVLGMVSTTISAAGISAKLRSDVGKLGVGSIFTPVGYLSFVFVVFIVALSYFVCAQVNGARLEEAAQRLETTFALPVDRRRWFGGRLALAAVAATALAMITAVATWAGAASQGVTVSLPRMLEAGANALPTAALFLGLCALVYAVWPRASAAVNYALVSVAFLWYTVAALFTLPRWIIDATPYEHIGFVPTQAFRAEPALIMVGIGAAAAAVAVAVFRHRDLLAT